MNPTRGREGRSSARFGGAAVLLLVGLLGARIPAQTPNAACSVLASQRLSATSLTTAEAVTGGSFTPAGGAAIANLPPFCRVAGTIAPTSESQIRFELWLPLDTWNGKFSGVGAGGWAGTISYAALGDQLRRGYATTTTNFGHEAASGFDMARFAFEKPEQLVDFAYRALHETTLKAKALAETFYGKPPQHAYFIGCSSGGYQGLMEAQRFPDDYNGIVAGMPANNWTRLMAGDLDGILSAFKNSVNNLPLPALSLLHRGALATCDGADGVIDGVIDDPRQCPFDPASLACTGNQEAGSCLTPPQVEAAKRIYGGLKDPKSGAQLYPGLAPGGEPFWPHRNPAAPFPIPVAHYRWLVFADPAWDWRSFDFGDPADYEMFLKAETRFAPLMNATSPDLRAFRQRGGKLLQYHGWNDQLIAPQNSIDYYESVVSFFLAADRSDRSQKLADVQTFYRLFMAPGYGALWWRDRTEHLRHADGPRGLDRTRRGSREGAGDATAERCRRSCASPLSVSAGRKVFRIRRHE